MLAEKKTRLHDNVLAVLALHTSSRIPLPRTQMLSVSSQLLLLEPFFFMSTMLKVPSIVTLWSIFQTHVVAIFCWKSLCEHG